jgi:hypothetical protein
MTCVRVYWVGWLLTGSEPCLVVTTGELAVLFIDDRMI